MRFSNSILLLWKNREMCAASFKHMISCPKNICGKTAYTGIAEMIMFMYFWLNYSDESNHLESIPVAVKNIDHILCMAIEILECDKLNLFYFQMLLKAMTRNT